MATSSFRFYPIIPIFVSFLFLSAGYVSSQQADLLFPANQTLRPGEELQKLKEIKAHLEKINKPSLKTIQSLDGDLIDCVLSHQQPAFDHPKLQGLEPLDPPERPKGDEPSASMPENFQLWTMGGESCPEGTIPIRRTAEKDVLRASSIWRFGRKARKPAVRAIRRDSTSSTHEHAVGYVMRQEYYGAKASINVWAPHVSNPNELKSVTDVGHLWLFWVMLLTPLKQVGRLVQSCMEITTLDSSLIGLRMHIKRLDATISCARGSSNMLFCKRHPLLHHAHILGYYEAPWAFINVDHLHQ